MNRTHSIQLVTDQGAFALFYSNEASAKRAFEMLRARLVDCRSDWVEVCDDEGAQVNIRPALLNSYLFSPIHQAGDAPSMPFIIVGGGDQKKPN